MSTLARTTVLATAAMIAAAFPGASAIAADTGASDRVVITDTRGRPPFKRARITTEAEFSRFEADEAATVRRSGHKGRPPFARHAANDVEPSTAEFSRFEEADDERRPTRRGPPGKMTSRR